MIEYRLVELKYDDHSSWVIEEKVKLPFPWGNYYWRAVEDENIIFDFDTALVVLKKYRNEKNNIPKRIILDV